MASLHNTLTKFSLCKIFEYSFNKIGSGHEDGEGADDGEKREGHQAQSIHHRCSKLPLAAYGLALILLPEAPGYVLHFLQNLGNFRMLLQQQQPGLFRVALAWGGAAGAARRHARVGALWERKTVCGHRVVAEV